MTGWYADTEIVRNLTDASRFDLCAEVAARLGLETKNDTTMWRDRAIVEVDVAVMHSFREAGMGECCCWIAKEAVGLDAWIRPAGTAFCRQVDGVGRPGSPRQLFQCCLHACQNLAAS